MGRKRAPPEKHKGDMGRERKRKKKVFLFFSIYLGWQVDTIGLKYSKITRPLLDSKFD
jgi:hypothetical protein